MRFGRFDVLARAGSGGAAEVWRGRGDGGEAVAIKVARDAAGAAALAREAGFAALASSPLLPELVDVGRDGSQAWLALRWVEGESLSGDVGRCSLHRALSVARDLGAALSDLHALGIAHGDVKADNCIVDDGGRARLIDLGLAVEADATALHGGTPRYLARGDADLGDARARDLVALGALLAELVSPAVAAAADAVGAARAAAIPGPLADLCAALLAPAPGARPSARWVASSAETALHALEAEAATTGAPRPQANQERARAGERDARLVRATYLRLRADELPTATTAHADAAPWLAEAIVWSRRARSLCADPMPSGDAAAAPALRTNASARSSVAGEPLPSPANGRLVEAALASPANGRPVDASHPAPNGRPLDAPLAALVNGGTIDPPLAAAIDPGGAARPGTVTSFDSASGELAPLDPWRLVRWLTLLVGSSAASWPVTVLRSVTERELAIGMAALARHRPPRAWTLADVERAVLPGAAGATVRSPIAPSTALDAPTDPNIDASAARAESAAALALAVARVPADALAMECVEQWHLAPTPLLLATTDALRLAGEVGRARSLVLRGAVTRARGGRALAADVLRRSGDLETAATLGRAAIADGDDADGRARATLARLALDAGDLDGCAALCTPAETARVSEVASLLLAARGDARAAHAEARRGEALATTPEERARLAAARGYCAHWLDPEDCRSAYASAVDHAVRAGSLIEEATYRVGEAAAAADLGELGTAIATSARAALLWESLERPAQAARAELAAAGAYAAAGAAHDARRMAAAAIAHARAGGDARAEAYASWAVADVEEAGAPAGVAAARRAAHLVGSGAADDHALRAGARLLRHVPGEVGAERRAELDGSATAEGPAAARLDWWAARARELVHGLGDSPAPERAAQLQADGRRVLAALLALAEARAELATRGAALLEGCELAATLGDGDGARRLLASMSEAARELLRRVPAELRDAVRALPWVARGASAPEASLLPEQAHDLEQLVRALGERSGLRQLLERVVDALVLWTGVERGLLLLRAPDDRLVPRAARNLLRSDLSETQLSLSQTLARRAMSERQPVVAVDAAGELSDVHRSVQVLKLRSVLAVPLVARDEVLGVVYLDDRIRRGAFGPRELSWARSIAALAAVAIADARDQVLLRRAARRARRASAELAETLAHREAALDVAERELARTRAGRETRFAYDEIVGESEPIRALLGVVDRVTSSEVPVLVVGESGSGKELVARAIHNNGPRAARPFVGENCGAIPEGLLESTLFGHARGAFTGAVAPRSGLFEAADKGTLFLDEIGEMSLGMQAKLLRVLEDGVVRPLGSERSRKVDVRVVAATHRDLEAMVAARTFREDLFYRLNIITLRIPPLRERSEDIPLIVSHLLAKHGGSKTRITAEAMARLRGYAWPGNVRQLENEVRRALVLSDGTIDRSHLSPDVADAPAAAPRDLGLHVRQRVDALEVQLVREALSRTAGNQTQAAKILGLSRFGLQKMMKRLSI